MLIVDNAVNGRATHAFVVGVSRYTHLEGGDAPTPAGKASKLVQLTSAARSASEFAAWVLNEYHRPDAPLASLEVCLAPQVGETVHPAIAAKLGHTLDATRDAVMEGWVTFRDRCLQTPDAVALVYVAGHGVQLTKRGATLLLEDYATLTQPFQLYAALDMVGLHESLYADDAAAHQFWFIDACRQKPAVARKFESLQGAYRDDERLGACRSSPLFLASGPQTAAWARVGGVSLFNDALLRGLRGGAAVGPQKRGTPWRVTTGRLASYVIDHVQSAAADSDRDQHADLAGHPGKTDEVIHFLPQPPKAKVTIDLTPAAARQCAEGSLIFNGNLVHKDRVWPFCKSVPAGLYLLTVDAMAPYKTAHHPLDVKPPELVDELEVPQ